MTKKNVDDKLPIYKLKTAKEILGYYRNWTENNKYNQDMVDMNYTAPKETVSILIKYVFQKDIKILDAGYKILFDPAAIVYHDWNFSEKGRDDRQILYLSFRHDLENIKRLLPLRYALPLLAYKIAGNLAKRYAKSGYLRCFFPDLVKVLPIFFTDYKEKKVKIKTYRWFTKEASKFFKDRDSYNIAVPLSQ